MRPVDRTPSFSSSPLLVGLFLTTLLFSSCAGMPPAANQLRITAQARPAVELSLLQYFDVLLLPEAEGLDSSATASASLLLDVPECCEKARPGEECRPLGAALAFEAVPAVPVAHPLQKPVKLQLVWASPFHAGRLLQCKLRVQIFPLSERETHIDQIPHSAPSYQQQAWVTLDLRGQATQVFRRDGSTGCTEDEIQTSSGCTPVNCVLKYHPSARNYFNPSTRLCEPRASCDPYTSYFDSTTNTCKSLYTTSAPATETAGVGPIVEDAATTTTISPSHRLGRSSAETTILNGLSSSRSIQATTTTSGDSLDAGTRPKHVAPIDNGTSANTTASERLIIILIVVAVVLSAAACCWWCLVRFCGCCCPCMGHSPDGGRGASNTSSARGTLRLWTCCTGCLRWCCFGPTQTKEASAAEQQQGAGYTNTQPGPQLLQHVPPPSLHASEPRPSPLLVPFWQGAPVHPFSGATANPHHAGPVPAYPMSMLHAFGDAGRHAPAPTSTLNGADGPGANGPAVTWGYIPRESSAASLLSNGYLEVAPDKGDDGATRETVNPLFFDTQR